MKDRLKALRRKIWLTRLSRINASNRFRKKDELMRRLSLWYSLCIVIMSVLNFILDFTYFSVFVLAYSLSLTLIATYSMSKNHMERSLNYKGCFLDLDELLIRIDSLDSLMDDREALTKINLDYIKLKRHSENHSTYDYLQAMESDPCERLSNKDFLLLWAYRLVYFIWTAALFLLPIIGALVVSPLF